MMASQADTAIIAVSRPGAALAGRLAAALPGSALYLERRTADAAAADGAQLYDLPLRPVLQGLFADCRAVVVFLPVGAAVRLLAPVLGSKRRDAAVVCVDDAGRYAVSVLSGHSGGADALAQRVADALGAQAVITAASDALQVTAVDMVGSSLGWRIEAAAADLTRAAAAMVNGDPVALWLDPETGVGWPDDCPLSDNITMVDDFADVLGPAYAAALAVSDRVLDMAADGLPVVVYRPPTLAAGVGCRRGTAVEHLRELVAGTLRDYGLAAGSLRGIATADIKADEVGIIALAESLGLPLHSFAGAELDDAGRRAVGATPSAAQDLLGVFGVSEPAALLAAGAGGRLVVPRVKSERATVAVARIAPAWHNGGDGRLGDGVVEGMAMDGQDGRMDGQDNQNGRNETGPGTDLLAAAELEIGRGNLRKGAGLAWQATQAALAACAARHGMPCANWDDARELVIYLDQLASAANPFDYDAEYRNMAALSVAYDFQEHYEMSEDLVDSGMEWEPDEYQLFLPSVQMLIARLNASSQRTGKRA